MNQTKLRVAHIITQLELGGAQRNTLYTCSHLDATRFEPTLIAGPGGILDSEVSQAAYHTTFVASLTRPVNPLKDLLAYFRLYRLLRRYRPHIVHTHSSKAGILGRIAAYLAGVPVIIHTFHGFGFTPRQSRGVRQFFVLLERWCARLSTHLVFVSEDNRQEAALLRIGVGKGQSLIRSGISFEATPAQDIRAELNLPATVWILISVGNFKDQKNPLELIEVASEVVRADPTIHVLLVGDGPLRASAERKVEAAGFGTNIHFLGWRADVAGLLAASNAFFLTSLWEGLPRAIVEAFAAKLPVVAYSVNGVRDILREEENGFPIAAGDIRAAAEKILWLRAHPEESTRFGEAGYALVQKEFDIDQMVRQQEQLYLALYESVPLREYYESRWTSNVNVG